MKGKMFDVRFLTSPFFLVLPVFLASPNYFLIFLKEIKDIQFVFTIVIGFGFLLGIGFFISSIVDFLSRPHRTPDYSPEEYSRLYSRFSSWKVSFECDQNAKELAFWRILDGHTEYIREQVHKRWDLAMANFNCAVAILFAVVIVLVLKLTPLPLWWLSVFIVVVLFILSGLKNYWSVLSVNKILIREEERPDSHTDVIKK